ncbi:MAG: hypothetical protein GY715_22455, partial [Planctomycetes bacterium]|nr:hypothetical protein [Planctomycetota bacterium]
TNNHSNGDEWLGVKDAARLAQKSEMTIRRLIKANTIVAKKDESGKSVVNKESLSNVFVLNNTVNNLQQNVQCSQNVLTNYQNEKHKQDVKTHYQNDSLKLFEVYEKQIEEFKTQIEQKDEQLEKQTADFDTQVSELKGQLEKQTTELKEQLKQKDAQLEKQADDFKELLSQKDQQIHQLHVLLKESKTSTIDYKPDDKVGVFSKVLMRFGL